MPSATALRIALRCEDFLTRALTRNELLKCEELALNFYPKMVLEYILRLKKKGAPKVFSMIVTGIECSMLRVARRNDFIRMRGRMATVYGRIGSFVGDAFSEAELNAIVFLADDCSDGEIDAAIAYARGRGIHNAAYLKAVILGNRKRYMIGAIQRGTFAEYIPDLVEIQNLNAGMKNVPRVDRIRDIWRFRVRKQTDRLKLITAELNAKVKRAKHAEHPSNSSEAPSS